MAETALRVIREVGVQPGQTLLASGASGGVGSAVLQIARDRGINVIGIAGAANQDYLRGRVPWPRPMARAGSSGPGRSDRSTQPSIWPARA